MKMLEPVLLSSLLLGCAFLIPLHLSANPSNPSNPSNPDEAISFGEVQAAFQKVQAEMDQLWQDYEKIVQSDQSGFEELDLLYQALEVKRWWSPWSGEYMLDEDENLPECYWTNWEEPGQLFAQYFAQPEVQSDPVLKQQALDLLAGTQTSLISLEMSGSTVAPHPHFGLLRDVLPKESVPYQYLSQVIDIGEVVPSHWENDPWGNGCVKLGPGGVLDNIEKFLPFLEDEQVGEYATGYDEELWRDLFRYGCYSNPTEVVIQELKAFLSAHPDCMEKDMLEEEIRSQEEILELDKQ